MVEAANDEFCIPRVSLIFDEIKIFNEKLTPTPEESEKSLLLVEVKKTLGPMIYCRNKNGEMKSYKRVNDQTLAI